ncbi:hypothetical protein B0T16DRAFT_395312 [Cercophora newfieldiana]|uniref:Uncharacterized protein n=1 Tax=Cercophora newfieldiana TaxID=92897 RepID=A0AA39XV18_9PEZI|nr:hypothetical protein B0T16DRAFT_395312 [Cercophora newfieldiana]
MKPSTIYGFAALAGVTQALLIPPSYHAPVEIPDTGEDGVFALSYDDDNQPVITTIKIFGEENPTSPSNGNAIPLDQWEPSVIKPRPTDDDKKKTPPKLSRRDEDEQKPLDLNKRSQPSNLDDQNPLLKREQKPLHINFPHETPSPLSPTDQNPLSKRDHPTAPGDLPIRKGDFGCLSESWNRLSDLPSYTAARLLLGRECDRGKTIPGYSIMWVRRGTSYAYACNYSPHTQWCNSYEVERADEFLNAFCPLVSEEVARESTGWVHMADWKKTYGRAKFGDLICGNLPRGNVGKAPPVGRTEDLGLAQGDCKKVGGYLQNIREEDWERELGVLPPRV